MLRPLTEPGVAQLSANNAGIHISPSVITHSAPGIILTNFHTSLSCHWPSNQSDGSVNAGTYEHKKKLF